jgi:hypothetical protein
MTRKKLLLVALATGLLVALTPLATLSAPNPSRPFQDDGCTHPMAFMLSEWMAMSCEDIMALHDEQDIGFGVMMKAYVLSKAFAQGDWESLLALHQEDVGWGQIMKAYALAGPLGRSPEDLLADAQASGWGPILQEYREQYGHGKPPWAGQGKPPWAGPHEPEQPEE